MSNPLTDQQLRVLLCVARHVCRDGVPPTLREISADMQFRSDNTARGHIMALVRKGYLERRGDIARGLKLTMAGREEVGPYVADMEMA